MVFCLGLSHPDELDMQYFENVCRNSDKYSFKPITYIAALLKNDDEVFYLSKTLSFQNYLSDDINKVNDIFR